MFNQEEVIEQFIRSKILLQEKLSEIGDIHGSPEFESQMMFVETRMIARLRQSILHGIEEMNSLRYMLIAVEKAEA